MTCSRVFELPNICSSLQVSVPRSQANHSEGEETHAMTLRAALRVAPSEMHFDKTS